MRAIYKIARLELSNLFYSPVAWLLLIFFTFMMGIDVLRGRWKVLPAAELGTRGYMPCRKIYFIHLKAFGPKSVNGFIC